MRSDIIFEDAMWEASTGIGIEIVILERRIIMTKAELLHEVEQAILLARMDEDFLIYINLETGELVIDTNSPYADDPAMCDNPEGLRKNLEENTGKYLDLPYAVGRWRMRHGDPKDLANEWCEEHSHELAPLFEK